MAELDDANVLELLEDLDHHAPLRNGLRRVAAEQGHWAGIPMPLDGEQLVIEPRYPHAKALMGMGAKAKADDEADDQALPVVNVFWSYRYRCRVAVLERKDGTRTFTPLRGSGNQATLLLSTLGCQDAWGIEQEARAVALLGHHTKHRQFKQYMLTGMFLETSPRSGIHYLFRRLRPTVALSSRTGDVRILCAMCMHPIGFYHGSFAGAMCPTDDVIAHLMLMRGDEAMFWRSCNQHEPLQLESGL